MAASAAFLLWVSYLAKGRHGVQRGCFCSALQSLLYAFYGNGHSSSTAQLSHHAGSILQKDDNETGTPVGVKMAMQG